jgi:acyl carrier protein
MKPEVIQPLSQYIATSILQQPERKIDPGESIITSGLIDSFSLVDLSIFIEANFGVLIEDTELNADTFDSLSQLADLILQRQS